MSKEVDITDKAFRFADKFGVPALIAVILVVALTYGLYFVLRYEVFYNRDKVEAMSDQMDSMSLQHSSMLSKQEAALELQFKGVRIQCATCWNSAANQSEIKRCGCNPEL